MATETFAERRARERTVLTDRQRAILDFIVGYIQVHGWAPSIRDIGAHFDIKSVNGTSDHLRALERKGYIERGFGKSRALRVLRQP